MPSAHELVDRLNVDEVDEGVALVLLVVEATWHVQEVEGSTKASAGQLLQDLLLRHGRGQVSDHHSRVSSCCQCLAQLLGLGQLAARRRLGAAPGGCWGVRGPPRRHRRLTLLRHSLPVEARLVERPHARLLGRRSGVCLSGFRGAFAPLVLAIHEEVGDRCQHGPRPRVVQAGACDGFQLLHLVKCARSADGPRRRERRRRRRSSIRVLIGRGSTGRGRGSTGRSELLASTRAALGAAGRRQRQGHHPNAQGR
mmetsp:Transcript_96754/g.273151  ORF Transcript_96754/g.273151 Transcript_96754/m.273151 type:complete len:254 (-) Transcript_96754:41-802(-)